MKQDRFLNWFSGLLFIILCGFAVWYGLYLAAIAFAVMTIFQISERTGD